MIDSLILSFRARWKVFLLSLAAQFVVASLLHFGAQAPRYLDFLQVSSIQKRAATLVSPQKSAPDILQMIQPKLEQKTNDFKLEKGSGGGSGTPLLPGPAVVYAADNEDLSAATEYKQASAYAAVDLDSGKVILEKNGDKGLPIASLTKIMTAVVASDLASAEEKFIVSYQASLIQPTKIGVVPGQKITLQELLHALLLTSANDGAQVIKEGINQKYGAEVFIQAMNAKAAFLGLKNTHFANPQGFDDRGNFSSAEDLAVLSAYALKNYPQIKEIVQKDYQYVEANRDHKRFDLYNWNGLLGVYPGVYGVKIGNTGKAGFTTVVASEREGHKLLVVLLGAPGVLERDLWAAQALDVAFAKFGLSPVGVTEEELWAKYATWKYWG